MDCFLSPFHKAEPRGKRALFSRAAPAEVANLSPHVMSAIPGRSLESQWCRAEDLSAGVKSHLGVSESQNLKIFSADTLLPASNSPCPPIEWGRKPFPG
eukprot:scaffold733_cov267-Pinguiococcus_pyrenoidosus.AAC.34